MSGGVDIGVHAQREGRGNPQFARDGVELGQFRLRLAVETVDSVGNRVFDFSRRLADTGKDNLAGIAAGSNHTKQLSAERPGLLALGTR